MKRAIRILEVLLLASIKVGATAQFISGVQNSISELKAAQRSKR